MTQLKKNSSSSDTKSHAAENGKEGGNEFGRGIKFREGAPIQLLKYNEGSKNEKFGQIALNPEALNILQTINEPLAIISVVGSYRRGKSWFANVLHGRHDGFDLGSKVEACTRGIYMWSPPFKLESKQSDGKIIQKRVIVLDSEGIDDPKQDDNWAIKLFILCLVVSSTFVYNINGIAGKDDIGKLNLMTDLSKFIQQPEDCDFLPRLVILLRDFNLERPESFIEYFLEKLNDVNPETATAIGQFFCEFDVYGLPYPGCKKKMLQHMEDAATDELDEDFVDEVEYAVKAIYSKLPLKYIGSSTMKGLAFVKFLQDVVENMNSSEISTLLSIPSEYESIIQFVAQEAIKEANGLYEERMMVEEENFPMLWNDFEEMHNQFISEANQLFYDKIIGSPTQMEGFIKQLHERISKFKEEFAKRNSEGLMNHNEKLAKKCWDRFVKIGLTQENLFENNDKFQDALKTFELAYGESMMRSPEAATVIASYKHNQYPAAIDYMTQLGRMNEELAKAMHAKDKAEKLQLELLAREAEFHREIEAQKREREANERNFRVKMEELEINIEQQQISHEEMQRSIVEENHRRHEELRMQLIREKEEALENQDRFYQEQLLEQIEANRREIQETLEEMQADREKDNNGNKEKDNDGDRDEWLKILDGVSCVAGIVATSLTQKQSHEQIEAKKKEVQETLEQMQMIKEDDDQESLNWLKVLDGATCVADIVSTAWNLGESMANASK